MNAIARACSTALLPAWIVGLALHPRTRRDLPERLGRHPAVPFGVVWIHAASVGEVGAAEALIAHLEGPVLLTTDTDTGAERARVYAAASGGRVVAAVRPIDHRWTLAPLWADARPRAVVFVEGSYWPALARIALGASVPVVRVSGRAGPRTRRWPGLQRLFPLTAVVARDEIEAEFFRATQRCPVHVGGDLKGDGAPARNPLTWERPFVVAASTRPGDEDAVLAAVAAMAHRPALLLAPRHRERFDAVAALLEARSERWARRSAIAFGRVDPRLDVVLLDSIGELGACLHGARAAFIGGTFDVRIGGHSPAEAARAGVPVVCGPATTANAQAFVAIDPVVAAEPGELGPALTVAMARTVEPIRTGAAAKTAELLAPLFREPAPECAPRPWARAGAALYQGALRMRELLPRRVVSVGVPVISIGSTNPRGPGKTSTARWFARELSTRGHRVGVALRGYRRGRRGSDVRLSTMSDSWADLGDEGALLAMEGLLVAAGPDRIEAALALVRAGADAIVLDDGLQHRRLHRDLDLVVIDGRFPNARGLFPVGERREIEAVPARAHGVIVHHAPEGSALPGAVIARRRPGPWRRDNAMCELPSGPVAAFAGLGRPADFLDGLDVGRFRALADHQPVDEELALELSRWAGELPLVTTAKDWVRLEEPLRSRVFWRDVEVEMDVPAAWLDWR